MPFNKNSSRAMERSVRPPKSILKLGFDIANVSLNTSSRAFLPAPIVITKVPSISKKTNRRSILKFHPPKNRVPWTVKKHFPISLKVRESLVIAKRNRPLRFESCKAVISLRPKISPQIRANKQ